METLQPAFLYWLSGVLVGAGLMLLINRRSDDQ